MHYSIGLGTYDSDTNRSIVVVPNTRFAYRLSKRRMGLGMYCYTVPLLSRPLDLSTVIQYKQKEEQEEQEKQNLKKNHNKNNKNNKNNKSNNNSNERMSLEFATFQEVEDTVEQDSGVELTKLIGRIRSGVGQQHSWLTRESKKVIRSQKSLTKELVKINTIQQKKEKAILELQQQIEQMTPKEQSPPSTETTDKETEEGTKELKETAIKEEIKDAAIELTPDEMKKFKKLKATLRKEKMLLQANEASLENKTFLLTIYAEYVKYAEDGKLLLKKNIMVMGLRMETFKVLLLFCFHLLLNRL